MTKVDQFESIFRSAAREVFRHEPPRIESVLVVTDRGAAEAKAFGDRVRAFLTVIGAGGSVAWRDVPGEEFQTAGELVELIETAAPDLICTYRNLHSTAWKWAYSLGTHVDVLTQHTDVPILMLPHPDAERSAEHALENTDVVMAVTDHLAGDRRMVSYGVRFTEAGGTLWLAHVEDEVAFERYIAAIGRIPEIDTDEAREVLARELLKEPESYIESCREVLKETDLTVKVETEVRFGHHLADYRALVDEHRIDLLVLNTKDEDQLAMHGIAYELAVELRHIPLLLL